MLYISVYYMQIILVNILILLLIPIDFRIKIRSTKINYYMGNHVEIYIYIDVRKKLIIKGFFIT